MKQLIKVIGVFLAGLMTWFSPVNMASTGMCCAACTMKKEEEYKIEYIQEKEDTEA